MNKKDIAYRQFQLDSCNENKFYQILEGEDIWTEHDLIGSSVYKENEVPFYRTWHESCQSSSS